MKKGNNSKLFARLATAMKHSVIVILIGIIRPIVIHFANYQEHVGEYGTHWNFFATIAVVTIFAALIPSRLNSYGHYVALGIMVYYEIFMNIFSNLKDYVLSNTVPRESFIDKNKEGIFQCFGYFSCYLIGLSFGDLQKRLGEQNVKDFECFKKQLFYCMQTFAVFIICWFIQPTSRRLVFF